MKLYLSPGACSLSPHIVLLEAGLAFTTERVNLGTKVTAGGSDYHTINPKGSVPALQLDDGQVLTEGPAIVQYLADLVPDKQLAAPAGSMQRYRLIEALNFISTELHKTFGVLFNQKMPPEAKIVARELLAKRIGLVARQLDSTGFMCGDQFSVADAYLFTVLGWSAHVELDLAPWPAVGAYLARIAARPAVHQALLDEGLIKA